MQRTTLLWLRILFVFAACSVAPVFAADQPFVIDDYFEIKRVTELALSSDGEMVAYAVECQSLEESRPVRTVYISATAPAPVPEVIEDIQKARNIAWIPGKQELAFLSGHNGPTQVFSYNPSSIAVRRHTDSDDPVTQFGFAPDGRSLAYITQKKLEGATLYQQLQTGEKGLLIDPDILRVQHFTDPNWRDDHDSVRRLWVIADEGKAAQVDLPGNPAEFHWSPDSTKLAVTYAAGERSTSLFANYRTSLGIYDVGRKRFRILAAATATQSNEPDKAYDSDGWIPGEEKLIVRRARVRDLFVSTRHPEWAIVDVSDQLPVAEEEQVWHELSLTGLDRAPLFHPMAGGKVLINKTVRGGMRSLYAATGAVTLEKSDIAQDVVGNITMVRFSAGFDRAVFVNDGLTHPPEIYLWLEGEGSSRLTTLNQDLAERRLPVAREVNWKSKDGTPVQGWLLLPDEPAPGEAPWPLITFVHGGPSMPMPVGFADYFRIWPYPFEVYALNGMAVFVPNYRGNTTFGRAFADPKRVEGEPVDDIITGVEHLIGQGIADAKQLAISGHSHGAWLAPMAMTHAKNFQAASYAEGAGNNVTVYDITSGRLNHELHDIYFGDSLYDNPERYLELSPVLHFKGLRTAALFEAGNRSLAITMISYPKAAKYAGMPTEFIIYPKTGHNPSTPRIQKESAIRNLDWFRFWLQGYEDPAPEKSEQYARWRKMRDEQCERLKGDDSPSYCHH